MFELSDPSRNWNQSLNSRVFLPSPLNPLLPTSRNGQHESSHTTPPFLGSPFNNLGSLGESLSQPRLIKPPQSDVQKLSSKFERMETFLKDSGFDSVGKFLKILFYNPSHLSGESDPWGSCHAKAVSRFLPGWNKIKMSDIISLIYKHKHSAPLCFTTLSWVPCLIRKTTHQLRSLRSLWQVPKWQKWTQVAKWKSLG